MVNKTISLEHELNERLKQEENASALISNLLNDYYKNKHINSKISKEEEEIKKIEEELLRRKELLNKNIEVKQTEQEKTDEIERHKEFKRKQAEDLRNSILEEIKRQEEKETNIN